MDFALTEAQEAIRGLSDRILTDKLPPEGLRALEVEGTWLAEDVWQELAKAGLLGLSLPEAHGGGGLGLLEACLVAEQLGRRVAPLPYVPVVMGAGLALAEFGTPEQQARHLPGLADGSSMVTVGLHERLGVTAPTTPSTVAAADGDGWRIDGEKAFVAVADRADAVLLLARTGESTSTAFLVDPRAAGVSLARQEAVNGEPQWTVSFAGVSVGPDAVLGEIDGGGDVQRWITDRVIAGTCATQIGVCEEAVAITASYVSTREQFGSRLGTFQAVGHRVADAYIDTEGIRLTTLQAIWQLEDGRDAADALAVAKFWAADAAQRVVHAAQHLHGGIGMDTDYPIHRYFRWAKVLELTLGGATPSLQRLGANLITQV